jgi:hypothetical protein
MNVAMLVTTPCRGRGRCLVLTTIIITLVGNLFFVVLPALSDSIPFFAGTILGFCAVAALLYAMWRGQNWGRWLLVAIYEMPLGRENDYPTDY